MEDSKSKKNKFSIIREVVNIVDNLKAEDILVLDFSDQKNSISDYFVICTGTSNTHVGAIASKLEKDLRTNKKIRPVHVEGVENSQWILLDYGDIVIHIFTKETRDYYDIESLWMDVKKINLLNE